MEESSSPLPSSYAVQQATYYAPVQETEYADSGVDQDRSAEITSAAPPSSGPDPRYGSLIYERDEQGELVRNNYSEQETWWQPRRFPTN